MNKFNDGIVTFCIKINLLNANSFNSTNNIKTKDSLKEKEKFFYKEESKRQQDILFASSQEKKLSLKISVPYTDNLESDYVAIINGYLYSIFHLDPDKNREKTYIYLERLRKIEKWNIKKIVRMATRIPLF